MTGVQRVPAAAPHYQFHGSNMSLSSLAVGCFQTEPKAAELTQEPHLLPCHINTLADNLDLPCVTAEPRHATMDKNTVQLLNATLNQVTFHMYVSFFCEHAHLLIPNNKICARHGIDYFKTLLNNSEYLWLARNPERENPIMSLLKMYLQNIEKSLFYF